MGLRKDILQEPVSELDIRELLAVKPDTTIREAAALMREKGLGCAIAVDDQGKPIGKFTERLLMKHLLKDGSRLDIPISQVMYKDANCIREDQPIADMVRLMQTRGLRFICVVDREGRAIGLTGQKGLMEYVAEHFPRQVKVQRMTSKLYMDQREGA